MLGASLLSLAGLATAAEPLTKLADNTTMVPGGSKPFDFFSAPVTAGKFVAWNGATADPGGGIYITELGSERPLAVLVGPGDSMPGGGTINGTGDASLCPDGSAVFFATSDPTARGLGSLLLAPAPAAGARASTDRTFETAVTIGDAAGSDGKFISFEPTLTVAGSLATGIHMVFKGLTDTGVYGVFRASRPAGRSRRLTESSWALTKLADNSTAMPSPDGDSRFVELGGAEGGNPISAAGDKMVFFGGNMKGTMDSANRDGFYQWDEATGLSVIADTNRSGIVTGMAGDGWHFTAFGSAAMAGDKDGNAVVCFMAEATNFIVLQPVVGIWCRVELKGAKPGPLSYIVGSTMKIPDSPEPVPAHQLFQYVDYPAVSLGADPGLSDYMVVFQGNDGIGRRGVYRAFGGELKTVTDWQQPMDGNGKVINIQLNIPAFADGGAVALWQCDVAGNEGIYTAGGPSEV